MRALEKPQARLIMADEVGLGKTIEAGLVLKELRARGVLDRVLVITPASLVSQWRFELKSKFNETFVFHDGGYVRYLEERYQDANPWSIEPNAICSLQFARFDSERERIAAAHWDLVIVDEAHHARRWWDSGEPRPNKGYRLLESLRDRVGGLLLLTATPMQLHDFELFSMVELVEPGLFENYWDFEEAREEIATINRHVAWLRAGGGDGRARDDLLATLRHWKAPSDVSAAPLELPAGRDRVCGWLEARHRLTEALVRNRKAEIGGFTKRKARRIPVEPTPEELALEADVRAYIRRQHERALGTGNTSLGLVMVTFQKLLSSSTRALAAALDNRALRLLGEAIEIEEQAITDDEEIREEVDRALQEPSADLMAEVEELDALANRARAIEDSKIVELQNALEMLFREHPDEKVLIFTQFIGTLELIRERLASKLRVEVFHGGMSRDEKDAAHRAFKNHAQVLVSSEAGGEGRNFQFCHILVNYDLPWNPMRVEQRIGRLDRVGQKRDVLIYNFEVNKTLDERILNVLEYRIQIFTESVGALDPILGEVEERLVEICLKDADAAEREFSRYEVDLETQLERARRQEKQLRDLVMDSRSFRRDEVARLLEQRPMATPVDLERFVRRSIGRYPKGTVVEEREGVLRVDVPPVPLKSAREKRLDVRDDYRGTFDYRTALDDESLEFFAFGHPLVELLVRMAQEDDFGPPVTVLEAEDGDVGPALLVDYVLRLEGVRAKEEILSHLVAEDGISEPPRLRLPKDGQVAVRPSLHTGWIDALARSSREAIEIEIARRFEAFREENDAALEAERGRLEKTYAFQVRHLTDRIDRNEQLVDQWRRWGGDHERRAIPLREGQIRQDRERIAEIEEERSEALAALDEKRNPTPLWRVLAATLVVPPGELAALTAGRG
jgi:superfamily II DNA or RNA helicase